MSERRKTSAWWRPYRHTLARLAPPLLRVALRLLRWTLRVDTVGAEALRARWARGEPAIVSFWHNRLLILPVIADGQPICIMVSQHRDGEIATNLLGAWGVSTVRGSATRGAVAGFLRLVDAYRSGQNLAVIPDGPRGPRYVAKPGVVHLAKAVGSPIYPISYAANRAARLRSWDRLAHPACRLRACASTSASRSRCRNMPAPSSSRRCRERARAAPHRAHPLGRGGGGGMNEPASRLDRVEPPPLPVPRPPPSALAQLAYLGYDAVGGLAALLALPALPWLLRRGYGDGAGERLGRLPAAALQLSAPPIWLHCASVGETRSAAPLVARLRERVPRRPLVVSTTTLTGRAVARDDLGADVATLLPVDALRIVDRVFRRVRPRAVILVETELWPGVLRAADAVGAPVAMVSGRLSTRALRTLPLGGPALSRRARACRRVRHADAPTTPSASSPSARPPIACASPAV